MQVSLSIAEQDCRRKIVIWKTTLNESRQKLGGLRKGSTLLPQPLQRPLSIGSRSKTTCGGPEAARRGFMWQQIKQFLNVFLPWGGTRMQNSLGKNLGLVLAITGAGSVFARSSRLKLLTPSLVPHRTLREGVGLVASHAPTLVIAFGAPIYLCSPSDCTCPN